MTGSAVSLHCAMLGSPVMKLAPMGSVSPAGVPSSLRHSVSSLSSLVSSAESGFTLTMDERKPFYSIRLVNFQRLREREKKKKNSPIPPAFVISVAKAGQAAPIMGPLIMAGD